MGKRRKGDGNDARGMHDRSTQDRRIRTIVRCTIQEGETDDPGFVPTRGELKVADGVCEISWLWDLAPESIGARRTNIPST
eukprot:scaffold1_cov375-Pavlova_lutheri.AAC.11